MGVVLCRTFWVELLEQRCIGKEHVVGFVEWCDGPALARLFGLHFAAWLAVVVAKYPAGRVNGIAAGYAVVRHGECSGWFLGT